MASIDRLESTGVALRQTLGALVRDSFRFESLVRSRWERIHNRSERITVGARGVRCEWKWTSPVDYCRFVRGADVRLMRAALAEWPIDLSDTPRSEQPAVSFLIGHRGLSRLPHLLLTLRSIAAQAAPIECIVIEQSEREEIRGQLPGWVRYVHQPVPAGAPYNRAATFNLAATLAQGEVLVIHDNDMLVPRGYAAELLDRADEGYEAIDLKRFIFYLRQKDSEAVFARGGLSLRERSEVVIQNLHGGSVAVTRTGYAAIGGMDETFVGWGGEDVEFWERAETLRATRFGYLPIVHLWHAAQPEKLKREIPAVARYEELSRIAPADRIATLRAQRQG
jgi:GT2 family glycosyltransferase